MKVLVVLTGELCFDGITNSVLNYYRAMDRSGIEIGIVSARGTNEEMKKTLRISDVRFIRWKIGIPVLQNTLCS